MVKQPCEGRDGATGKNLVVTLGKADYKCFYEFYRQIQYKCNWNNIEFITADRYYPSSKMCSCCGNIKKDLKLKDRTYICAECGNVIDRDYQASVNLQRYKELTA